MAIREVGANGGLGSGAGDVSRPAGGRRERRGRAPYRRFSAFARAIASVR